MPKGNKPQENAIQIMKIEEGHLDVYVIGTAPLVINRMSEKAKRTLVLPSPRMNSYDRATTLKHHPFEEFRASVYRIPTGDALLALPATAFKGALSTAALDIPGAKKSQIARLTYVQGEYVGIYGIPKLYMNVMRMADISRKPDIRTRACIPEWAAHFTVSYVTPLLNAGTVAKLIAASGLYTGVGDGRPEKGKTSFGRFRLCQPNDPDYKRIVKFGGRKLQNTALEAAEPYDDETKSLLTWWSEEIQRRNTDESKPKAKAKTNGRIPAEQPAEVGATA